MSLHLAEISHAVAPGAHAVLPFDQAGRQQSRRLVVPANITLMPLPAKAPELKPVENIWQFMRELGGAVAPVARATFEADKGPTGTIESSPSGSVHGA